MGQNTNRTKYKNSKIQTRQNTKGQNTKCQITNVTKYNCNTIQMEKNTNRTKCKNTKIQKLQNTDTWCSNRKSMR